VTVEEIASKVSRWILAENDEWRKMAYIIANTDSTSVVLRDYLVGLIQDGGSPGILAIDLCMRVGLELQPGEHERLRIKLEEREKQG